MAKRITPDNVIDLTLDSDDEQESWLGDIRKNLYPRTPQMKKKKIKTEGSNSKSNATAASKYDEVEIVDAPDAQIAEEVAANDAEADGEVLMVGTVNETRLPHMRQHCTKFKFEYIRYHVPFITLSNALHCDLCYCYVCDKPAKECASWQEGAGFSTRHMNHCNATDEDWNWKNQRQQASKKKNPPPTSATPRAPSRSTDSRDALREARESNIGPGPFPPNHTQAAESESYSACSGCGWHSAKSFLMRGNHDGRCMHCGRRVLFRQPSDRDREVRVVNENDIDFGTKVITFRIVAKNIQFDSKYRDAWRKSSWIHDMAKEEEDYFKYKVGDRPRLREVMRLIPSGKEETVRHKKREGIILDNPNDYALFNFLDYQVRCRDSPIKWNISASWQSGRRSGKFTLRLFVAENINAATGRMSGLKYDYSVMLGLWFNVFPLKLSDLSGTLKARSPSFRHQPDAKALKQFKLDIAEHNRISDARSLQLSLTSSSGTEYVGGTTDNRTSLEGVLKRFHQESFNSTKIQGARISNKGDWTRSLNHHYEIYNECNLNPEGMLLNFRDRTFADHFLQFPPKTAIAKLNTNGGLMEHLENIGHEAELTCEGLTVELLDFQKQTLRWALERETIPGGVQALFWPQVPVQVDGNKRNVYFCPISGQFRTDKPKLVRGGIIAEEMGLGKTVISLGLILKNPAPARPVSGSHISSLRNMEQPREHDGPTWDQELYAQTSIANVTASVKRGSILSRGTLVVCPVSLVGQWIEEAKSKLEDPGLVYSYHGGNRKRDPQILAKNAIVVTTYQVVASDDSYWRGKAGPDYCPPLEQIRWWRVICDEGHVLRASGTQTGRSMSSLVADHKWIVTGTPVNTDVKDLMNQLRFVGIERVHEIFGQSCNNRSRGGIGRHHDHDPIIDRMRLITFLRSVMIRHTQKQRYRGTQTTLMSLPAKLERQIEITLPDAERREYDKLDDEAKKFYVTFKRGHKKTLSKHYLVLSQKLTPLRVACSGGHIPEDVLEDEENQTKKKKKKATKNSNFCFTAKFKVLLKELERVRDDDPGSKSLIFSQYTSTLGWLQTELPKHGFQFRTLSGDMSMKKRAKALHDFQSDPPTTVFLLSMRAGNCGINLTQANRVFLMEPGFNPALEQQAIGRVHRLGQKRQVEIVRLVVKDSIETRLRAFLKKKYGDSSSTAKGEEEFKSNDSKPAATTIGPVGNQATERPKSDILGEEFDMLFGVETDTNNDYDDDVLMPDAATSGSPNADRSSRWL